VPRDNRSCEAGVGSVKARTHHRALRGGYSGEWTCDDAEAARLEANPTTRPCGLRGPVHEEYWQARQRLEPQERAAFAETIRRLEREARAEQGYGPEASLGRTAQAAASRAALRRPLVAHG
jgi:hypothetical protein